MTLELVKVTYTAELAVLQLHDQDKAQAYIVYRCFKDFKDVSINNAKNKILRYFFTEDATYFVHPDFTLERRPAECPPYVTVSLGEQVFCFPKKITKKWDMVVIEY